MPIILSIQDARGGGDTFAHFLNKKYNLNMKAKLD